MTVHLTVEPSFDRGLVSLPPNRRKAAGRALLKFVEEPGLPSLRFRPLAGRAGYYILSAGKGDRIILRKEEPLEGDEGERFAVVDVGPHDNVYRRWDR